MSRYNVHCIPWAGKSDFESELVKLGCDPTGVKIMTQKGEQLLIYVERLPLRAANLLKQELLSRGGDLAVHRDVAGLSIDETNGIIIATKRQLQEVITKCKVQPFGLKTLAKELRELLKNLDQRTHTISMALPHGQAHLEIGKRTLIMGILNVTPDSFSDGGNYTDIEIAVRHAKAMVAAGADIIDLGGESTRPGHEPVPLEEELRRVIPVVQALSQEIDVPISIDTYKAEVARQAVAYGAHIINDVWGAKEQPEIAQVAAQMKVPIILMHNRKDLNYRNLIADMMQDLRESIKIVKDAGCTDEQIIIDPGIGFAKSYEDNLEVIEKLECFASLGYPILLGTSRKSMIGKTLDLPVDQRVEGTIATCVIGIQKGVDIVRVHDVEAVSRAVKMTDAIVRRGCRNG